MNWKRVFPIQVAMIGLALAGFGGSGAISRHAWAADPPASLKELLTFHASFDQTADADFALGDRRAMTGEDLSRAKSTPGLPSHVQLVADRGRWGGAVQFKDVSPQVFYYHGKQNIPYASQGWDATISFWMQLSPELDLKPGFVDPLQITDKEWNNSALFVDFTKDDTPRHFRLGVFSDYKFWNPQDTPWDNIPDAQRPMVVVTRHPFQRDRWTHVAIRLTGINRETPARSELLLDGVSQGIRTAKEQFTWDESRVAVMLGIQYIGWLDDFSVFHAALSDEQIKQLREMPDGVKSLR